MDFASTIEIYPHYRGHFLVGAINKIPPLPFVVEVASKEATLYAIMRNDGSTSKLVSQLVNTRKFS